MQSTACLKFKKPVRVFSNYNIMLWFSILIKDHPKHYLESVAVILCSCEESTIGIDKVNLENINWNLYKKSRKTQDWAR